MVQKIFRMHDMNTLLQIHNVRSTQIPPIYTDLEVNEFPFTKINCNY